MGNNPPCIDSFWAAYGDSSLLIEIPPQGPTGSIAADVLGTYSIPAAANSNIGGNLQGLDIKHMDAMAVINLSLLEEMADRSGGMFEAIVNNSGEVEFVEIGKGTANLSDIYYQVQTFSYVEPCKGVLVRGGQIMPTWKEMNWQYIWGDGTSKDVHHTTQMVTNCMYDNFSTHATITFNDPHLDNSSYNDGIDNLYDVTSPWDKIIGYARFIDCPNATPSTKITLDTSTTIPIEVGGRTNKGPNMGTLKPRPSHDPNSADTAECWQWMEGDSIGSTSDGVIINLPESLRFEDVSGHKVDKFVKVAEVLLIGRELSMLHSGALDDSTAVSQDPIDTNTLALISEDNMNQIIFRLEEGKHYAILYKEDGDFKQPYILFAKDARPNEPKTYGQDTKYIVSQYGESGYFKAGETGVGTIFPVAGNRGILVQQIYALVDLDTPSISIYDPEQPGAVGAASKALDLANALEYWVTPIMVTELPPSISFNGSPIDQKPSKADNDPTTAQVFDDTPLEVAYDQMDGGGGVELTLPFFNDPSDDVKLDSLSGALYDFMNAGTGLDTTYVCGPDTDVTLGEAGPAGGIVNSISYSYTDSGSYTVSVNEGPRLVKNFSGGGPSGPTMKASDNFSSRGTIIDTLGNGMFFKVRIDGYGERIAINMSPSIIKIGDVVQCTVHNNPVEA